jgi:hypothetical protein
VGQNIGGQQIQGCLSEKCGERVGYDMPFVQINLICDVHIMKANHPFCWSSPVSKAAAVIEFWQGRWCLGRSPGRCGSLVRLLSGR